MHISHAHAQTHAAVIPNTVTIDSKVVFPMETHIQLTKGSAYHFRMASDTLLISRCQCKTA